jgi:hypothetical protein
MHDEPYFGGLAWIGFVPAAAALEEDKGDDSGASPGFAPDTNEDMPHGVLCFGGDGEEDDQRRKAYGPRRSTPQWSTTTWIQTGSGFGQSRLSWLPITEAKRHSTPTSMPPDCFLS